MKINYSVKVMSTLLLGLILVFSSCRTIPEGVKAVQPFYPDKYLGKWYEIARLDYKFERNMNNVTAQYSMKDENTIRVLNRGYNYKENKWKQKEGKAKFVDSPDIGKLKVSFFGPFYAGYNVVAIDPDYKYALVIGKNKDYIWFLSRETTMPESIKKSYLQKANQLGYDTSKLIWVEHNK